MLIKKNELYHVGLAVYGCCLVAREYLTGNPKAARALGWFIWASYRDGFDYPITKGK